MRHYLLSLVVCFPCVASGKDGGCILPPASAKKVSVEDFTLAKVDANAPSSIFRISSTSTMDFKDVAGGFSLDRITLNAPLSGLIHINNSNALSIGLQYEGTWLESDTLLGDTDLHDVRVGLTWLHHRAGSRWAWLASIDPGIASDFNQIDSDDFSLNWKTGVRYAVTDRFSIIASVGVTNRTGNDDITPTLGFQWQATDHMHLSLTGATFTATWQPHSDWLLRFGVWPAGGIWNVEQAGQSLDVNLTSYRAAIGVERRLSNKTWLSLWVGSTLLNELEVETTSGSRLFKEDADNGWFVHLGLRVAAW